VPDELSYYAAESVISSALFQATVKQLEGTQQQKENENAALRVELTQLKTALQQAATDSTELQAKYSQVGCLVVVWLFGLFVWFGCLVWLFGLVVWFVCLFDCLFVS
jgi:hypothetical protein